MVSWTQFTVLRARCDGQMETPAVGVLCIEVCADCEKTINLLKEFGRKREAEVGLVPAKAAEDCRSPKASPGSMARARKLVWDGTQQRYVYEC